MRVISGEIEEPAKLVKREGGFLLILRAGEADDELVAELDRLLTHF